MPISPTSPFSLALGLILLVRLLSAEGTASPIVVNTAETHQTIDGFGACIVYYDLVEGYQEAAFYDALVFDLGLSMLRIPLIGHEEFSNDNECPDTYNPESEADDFSAQTLEIAKQFTDRGIETVLATPWSPPGWMKTNRSLIHGGRLRPDMREEYAEYLATYIEKAQRRFSIEISAISLQNELLFIEPYRSCQYNPIQLRNTLKPVSRRFRESALGTSLVLPEDMGMARRFSLWMDPIHEDPATRDFKGILASHGWDGFGNWQHLSASIAHYDRKFWMTETSGHNPDWKGAMAMLRNLHEILVGGNASAYFYWQVADSNPGRAGLFGNGQFTPKAHAAKHFFRLIRPGSKRVHVAPQPEGLLTSAFVHPQTGAISIHLVNLSNKPGTVDLLVLDDVLPDGWTTYTSTENCYFRESRLDTVNEVYVPPESIVSVYGVRGKAAGNLPDLQPEGWIPPALGPVLGAQLRGDLHMAARANNADQVLALIEEGFDPEALNPGGFSPLHRAAYPGYIEAAQALLSKGANPDVRDRSGVTPIDIAASNGHDDFIKYLVKAGATVDMADYSGKTPLHTAALAGKFSTVQTLVELGADPNRVDDEGWGSLHWASASPHADSSKIIRWLIQAGAGPNATDNEGKTVLHIAAANCVNPPISQRVPAEAAGQSVNAQRLQPLLDAGIPVNARDLQGRTALHWLAWIGETHYREDAGGLPSFRYLTAGIQCLLDSGADPSIKDEYGRTAADYAAGEGYHETANLLMTASTRRNPGRQIMETGETRPPLKISEQSKLDSQLLAAADEGDLQKVQMLIDAGANPDSPGFSGGGPLHRAVLNGHREVVQFLLQSGASKYLRDSDGYTPVDRAIQGSLESMLEILEPSN